MTSLKSLFRYLCSVDRIWLVIWLVIFSSFLLLDLISPQFIGVTVLKYLGILLNLVYSRRKFPKDYLLQIALLFTLLADTILAINHTALTGVFTFCFAQLFHLARLNPKLSPKLIISATLIILLVFYFSILQQILPMFAISAIYAFFLISNLFSARRWYRQSLSIYALHALLGFCLFICCDVFVSISYLSHLTLLPSFLYPLANYLAWVFYYPSQIFIANSSTTLPDYPMK